MHSHNKKLYLINHSNEVDFILWKQTVLFREPYGNCLARYVFFAVILIGPIRFVECFLWFYFQFVILTSNVSQSTLQGSK